GIGEPRLLDERERLAFGQHVDTCALRRDTRLATMPAVLDEPHAIAGHAVARDVRGLAADREVESTAHRPITELNLTAREIEHQRLVRGPDVAPTWSRELVAFSSRCDAMQRCRDRRDTHAIEAGRTRAQLAGMALEKMRVELARQKRTMAEDARE